MKLLKAEKLGATSSALCVNKSTGYLVPFVRQYVPNSAGKNCMYTIP